MPLNLFEKFWRIIGGAVELRRKFVKLLCCCYRQMSASRFDLLAGSLHQQLVQSFPARNQAGTRFPTLDLQNDKFRLPLTSVAATRPKMGNRAVS